MRIEKVTCDVKECTNEAPIEHNMNYPNNWDLIGSCALPKNFYICPDCRKKLSEILDNYK